MADSYKLDELAQAAGVAARTIRYYVQRGLLPAPEFRGRDTAYGSEHLLRLQAIRRLQGQHLPLDEIQARLAGLTAGKLAGLAGGEATTRRRGRAAAVVAAEPAVGGERWERVVLAPGLELHVREDADPRVRALARAIERAHGPGGDGSAD